MGFKLSTIVFGVVIASVLIFGISRFTGDDFDLPEGEAEIQTITISEKNELVDDENKGNLDTEKVTKEIEVMITDGVKHSIPLEDIKTLLGKDDIPPIDEPKFISVGEASDWLNDGDPGIAVSVGDTHRFYPYQILVWHEIVNDSVDGKRFLVSYCPLCLTGIVFDPVVDGERVEFGTSGKLWESNLIMYDRKTDSLWSQVLGEAIVGEMTGSKLAVLPSDQVLYEDWRVQFPEGEVLSKDTGAVRFYGSSPYGGYFNVTDLALSMVDVSSPELPPEAFIFGITVEDQAKAYSVDSVKEKGEVTDTFAGKTFILRHDTGLDVVRMYESLPDGTEERINPFSAFWFSWVAAHPDTKVYK